MRIAKLTGFLLYVVVLIVILDASAAYFFFPRNPGVLSDDYHHDLRKNYNGYRVWGSLRYPIHTDSLGFCDSRVREVTSVSDKYRILFMGDSFTEGVGCPYEDTFVGIISKRLDPDRYEVLNAAVLSYSPHLYFLKTKYLLETKKLRINELVVFIDISDMSDEIVYSTYAPHPWSFAVRAQTFLKNHSLLYRFISELRFFFRHHLYFFRGSAGVDFCLPSKKEWPYGEYCSPERANWPVDDEVWKKWGAAGARSAVHYMDELYKLCGRYGIKMSIAIYPWREQVGLRECRQTQIWHRFADERNMPILDLFPSFLVLDPQVYLRDFFITGDTHWNAKGHALVADSFMRFRFPQSP